MKKEQSLAEDALLSGDTLENLIKKKMEEEVNIAFAQKIKKIFRTKITDIKQIPNGKLFTKDSVFKCFNKNNQSIAYINGIQAEALLGLNSSAREKLVSGETDVFSTANSYVKFEYSEMKA